MLLRLVMFVLLSSLWWVSCAGNGSSEEFSFEGLTEAVVGNEEAGAGPEPVSKELLPETIPEASFVLKSSAFRNNKSIPEKYGCVKDGSFVKPSIPLEWTGAPLGTKSFVVLMDDATPLGREWIHWAVINIPSDVASLPEDASGKKMPKESKELSNTWQQPGYGGPCPPTNVHVFRIRLFALSEESIQVIDSAQSSELVNQLPVPLGVAELRGTYP